MSEVEYKQPVLVGHSAGQTNTSTTGARGHIVHIDTYIDLIALDSDQACGFGDISVHVIHEAICRIRTLPYIDQRALSDARIGELVFKARLESTYREETELIEKLDT